MASPSSSKTSPSPLLLAQRDEAESQTDAVGTNQQNIDAFLKRADLAKLTRALRARLSYASYKATNNISHVPLDTLEHQHTSSPPHTPTYQDHHLSQVYSRRDSPQSLGSSSSKQRLSYTQLMPPPASPRSSTLYSALLGKGATIADLHGNNADRPSKRARHTLSQSHSLASVASSSKKKARVAASPSRASGTRSSMRNKAKAQSPSNRSAASTVASADAEMSEPAELEDMDAAAALTSLLHNMSSGRTHSAPSSPSRASSMGPETHSLAPISSSRESSGHGALSPPSIPQRKRTPKPDDSDAAELMLFLATSPSPARGPSRKRERPNADGGHHMLRKGRILFPTSSMSSSSSVDDDIMTEPGTPRPERNISHLSLGGLDGDDVMGSHFPSVPGNLLSSSLDPPAISATNVHAHPTSFGAVGSNSATIESLQSQYSSPSSFLTPYSAVKNNDPPTARSTYSFSEYLNVPSSPLRNGAVSSFPRPMSQFSSLFSREIASSDQTKSTGTGNESEMLHATEGGVIARRLFEEDHSITATRSTGSHSPRPPEGGRNVMDGRRPGMSTRGSPVGKGMNNSPAILDAGIDLVGASA